MIQLTSTEFVPPIPSLVHIASDWEVAIDPDFINVFDFSYNDRDNLTSFTSLLPLIPSGYYARVRYRLNKSILDWSNTVYCGEHENEISY